MSIFRSNETVMGLVVSILGILLLILDMIYGWVLIAGGLGLLILGIAIKVKSRSTQKKPSGKYSTSVRKPDQIVRSTSGELIEVYEE